MHIVGWYQKRGQYGSDGLLATDTLKEYAFTQQMVWETLGQSTATFVDANIQSEYEIFKNEVNNKMAKMGKRASFDNTTITLKQGETNTVTDTNNVLADYETIDVTKEGIRITHNKGENYMTFTVTDSCTIEQYRISDDMFLEWGLIKDGTQDKKTTVYIEFETGVQDQLYSLNYNDPVTLKVSLAIEAKGELELTKRDTNGELIDGAVFTVTSEDEETQEVTVSNGEIIIDNLKPRNLFDKGKNSPL